MIRDSLMERSKVHIEEEKDTLSAKDGLMIDKIVTHSLTFMQTAQWDKLIIFSQRLLKNQQHCDDIKFLANFYKVLFY